MCDQLDLRLSDEYSFYYPLALRYGLVMIPIAKPSLGEEEANAAREAILSGWVTQGPRVKAFEEAFAEYTGAPFACAVSSCTTALHLALAVVGVSMGDEVVTVSHSYIATANAIRYCGAIPVFVDVQRQTLNMDPALVEAAITSRTRAILCVHQVGMPCDMPRLVEIAARHNLPLIEDAACAIGSEIQGVGGWERIGKPHGDIACFSFHPRKVITTGDGGMLTTAHEKYDQAFRLLRQHGMSISDRDRHGSDRVIFESYDALGYNYRMTDIQASIGIEQLKKLPYIIEERRRIASVYQEAFMQCKAFELRVEGAGLKSNWQSFFIDLNEGLDQRAVMQALLDREISSRRGIMCAHLEKAYEGSGEAVFRVSGSLSVSEEAQRSCVALPMYAGLKDDELGKVIEGVVEVCG